MVLLVSRLLSILSNFIRPRWETIFWQFDPEWSLASAFSLSRTRRFVETLEGTWCGVEFFFSLVRYHRGGWPSRERERSLWISLVILFLYLHTLAWLRFLACVDPYLDRGASRFPFSPIHFFSLSLSFSSFFSLSSIPLTRRWRADEWHAR